MQDLLPQMITLAEAYIQVSANPTLYIYIYIYIVCKRLSVSNTTPAKQKFQPPQNFYSLFGEPLGVYELSFVLWNAL